MPVLFAYLFFLKDSVRKQNWEIPYFTCALLYLVHAVRHASPTRPPFVIEIDNFKTKRSETQSDVL